MRDPTIALLLAGILFAIALLSGCGDPKTLIGGQQPAQFWDHQDRSSHPAT
jgi:hypothetical protein